MLKGEELGKRDRKREMENKSKGEVNIVRKGREAKQGGDGTKTKINTA